MTRTVDVVYSLPMTTITATFNGETYTRETEHAYTFASKRDGVVRFHESSHAAKRAAGAYGQIVRTDYVRRHRPTEAPAAPEWVAFDAQGNEVGFGSTPPEAMADARRAGQRVAGARRVS